MDEVASSVPANKKLAVSGGATAVADGKTHEVLGSLDLLGDAALNAIGNGAGCLLKEPASITGGGTLVLPYDADAAYAKYSSVTSVKKAVGGATGAGIAAIFAEEGTPDAPPCMTLPGLRRWRFRRARRSRLAARATR